MSIRSATFRFYAELNDFLDPPRRGGDIPYTFSGRPAVKDAIEALGVPHPEVEVIVIDGRSVGFDHRLDDGMRVAVYPMFEAVDVAPIVRLRERPLRRTRFVLDAHLGKLARLLRLLGFDTLYRNDYDDPEIVRVSLAERRVVLTRDRGLLKRGALTHGYCVRSDSPTEQAREVVSRFDLRGSIAPFTRCTMCNTSLRPVAKAEVESRLGARTRRDYDEFHSCPGCGRIYWKGSHVARLRRIVERLAGPSCGGSAPACGMLAVMSDDVTQLLRDWRGGDEQARETLWAAVYGELRRLAGHYMSDQRGGHTLQPTALVHEAFVRLVDAEVTAESRGQFMALAARAMRSILVDHARSRGRAKRGGDVARVTLNEGLNIGVDAADGLLELDDALRQLAERDRRKADVVELHFFGGLGYEEIAGVLEVSLSTVRADMRFAKAWLVRVLETHDQSPPD